MKKLVVVMFCCGMSQVIGSSDYELDYTLMEARPYPVLWHTHRASAVDLAEGTAALVEGFKSLAMGLWNSMTQ